MTKLFNTLNEYKSSNFNMTLTEDLKNIKAYSYNWWCFVKIDNIGNLIFNDCNYSNTTNGHQSNARNILRRLNLKISLRLNYTQKPLNNINEAIKSEINCIKALISKSISSIKTKGSWKKTNKERRESIKNYLYKIKDLRNYKDNYIDKKLIPIKNKYHSKIEQSEVYLFDVYFSDNKGKIDINGRDAFLKEVGKYHFNSRIPQNIDNIKDLLGLKKLDLRKCLYYKYVFDINNMIPNKDSNEYLQLLKVIKRLGINRDNLNTFSLDKIHNYLTNKINRKDYVPSKPTLFNISKELLNIENTKHLRLIKSDKALREEGRRQSHCIGGKNYINDCINGHQALNYKEYTFFLDAENTILQSSGKHNASVPSDITIELKQLIGSK